MMSDIILGKARSNTGNKKSARNSLQIDPAKKDNLADQQSGSSQYDQPNSLHISRHVTTIRSAPLPTVEEFAGYEDVHKGAAGEILSMASSAQKHQQWMDRHHLFYDFILRISSTILGAALLISMLYWAYQAGMSGNNWLAWILLGSAGFSAIGVLWRQRIHSEEKPQAPPPKTPQEKLT